MGMSQGVGKALMKTIYRAMNILGSGKFVQKIKYGCELQGLPVGECRAPLGPLTKEEKAEFRAAMEPILSAPAERAAVPA